MAEIATTLVAQLNDHGTLAQRMVTARVARYYQHNKGQWKGGVAEEDKTKEPRGSTKKRELHYAGIRDMMAKLSPGHTIAANHVGRMARTDTGDAWCKRWYGKNRRQVWGLRDGEQILEYEGGSDGSLYKAEKGTGEAQGWATRGVATTTEGRRITLELHGSLRSFPDSGTKDSSARAPPLQRQRQSCTSNLVPQRSTPARCRCSEIPRHIAAGA